MARIIEQNILINDFPMNVHVGEDGLFHITTGEQSDLKFSPFEARELLDCLDNLVKEYVERLK